MLVEKFFHLGKNWIEKEKKKGENRNREQFLNSKKKKNETTIWTEAIYIYIFKWNLGENSIAIFQRSLIRNRLDFSSAESVCPFWNADSPPQSEYRLISDVANVIGFATVKGHRYPGVAHLKNKRKKKRFDAKVAHLRPFSNPLLPLFFPFFLLFPFFPLSSRNQTKISCGKRVGEAGWERKEKRVIGKRVSFSMGRKNLQSEKLSGKSGGIRYISSSQRGKRGNGGGKRGSSRKRDDGKGGKNDCHEIKKNEWLYLSVIKTVPKNKQTRGNKPRARL